MATYKMTIFDAHPDASGATSWPQYTNVAFDAGDNDEAEEHARAALDDAAGECRPDDYRVGQRIYALVWNAAGVRVAREHRELTARDLGVEEDPPDAYTVWLTGGPAPHGWTVTP